MGGRQLHGEHVRITAPVEDARACACADVAMNSPPRVLSSCSEGSRRAAWEKKEMMMAITGPQ